METAISIVSELTRVTHNLEYFLVELVNINKDELIKMAFRGITHYLVVNDLDYRMHIKLTEYFKDNKNANIIKGGHFSSRLWSG